MGARQSVQQSGSSQQHNGSGGGPSVVAGRRTRTMSSAVFSGADVGNGGAGPTSSNAAMGRQAAAPASAAARGLNGGRSLSVSAVESGLAALGRTPADDDGASDSSSQDGGVVLAALPTTSSASTSTSRSHAGGRSVASTSSQQHGNHHHNPHHNVRSMRRLPQLEVGGVRVSNRHIPHIFGLALFDIKCPVCHKVVPSDEAEVHLVMCLTRPKLTYNEDVLSEDKGECVICLEEMVTGEAIARLPCLCIYHKPCIDSWFSVKNNCPEHPGDDD